MVEFVRSEIDILMVVKEVGSPASGATDVFIGTTRDVQNGKRVTLLEYEAYESMAAKEIKSILNEARATWRLEGAAIIHRLGKVPVGEASVVIAVSAAHRKEAFEACRYLIDRLKSEVPIWKKEYFADGSVEWSRSDEFLPSGRTLS